MAALEGFCGHCASLMAAMSSALPAAGPASSTRTGQRRKTGASGNDYSSKLISIQNMNCSGSRPEDTSLRAPSRRMGRPHPTQVSLADLPAWLPMCLAHRLRPI